MNSDLRNQVEDELGTSLTNAEFGKAITRARRKQRVIFVNSHNTLVLQPQYFARLTIEAARALMLTKITLDVMSQAHNMEKEHQNLAVSGTPSTAIL